MKQLAYGAAAVALLVTTSLWAQQGGLDVSQSPASSQNAPGQVQVRAGNVDAAGIFNPAEYYIAGMDKIVGLTDAQKKTLTDIFAARAQAMKDFQTQNAEKLKTAQAALSAAYQSQDQNAIAQAQQQYQAVYAPIHEIMKKSQADLDNVLTPEQKATLFKSRGMQLVKTRFTAAKLTDDQLKQTAALCDELAKNSSINDRETYAKLMEKVNALLTADQQEAMKTNSPGTNTGRGQGGLAPGTPAGSGQLNVGPNNNPTNPAVTTPATATK